MPQFKECTVDELLRDSLIDFSLKHNNKEMFESLTSEQWEDYIVKEEYKEKYYKKYYKDEIELHKIILDKYISISKLQNKDYLLNECYKLFDIE
ncbi:hypothetical protein AXJ14_gp176 [Geobacillus virus E3]|uniref:hypothetical protein n=1 Tax=Geobacillus virus E3 TaxID=1572712 RepID=UPI000671B09C|nr:hypothetical protein AXJ14_gp176 [Geobacillus virus E3]AJA41495.1 hypothetical protein E3_0176 [Geobacillus virus E3]